MTLAALAGAKRYVGYALDLPRIYTVTIGGTYVAADSVTLTVNDKDLTVTVNSSVATTDVAAALHAAFNGSAIVDDETRTTTGPQIGELFGCTATVSGSVVTITGRAGHPLTLAESKSSTSGTIALSSLQAPTGKHYADNAANYSDGSTISSEDVLVLINTDVDILYALDEFDKLSQLDIYASYTGKIGLPDVNRTSTSYPYAEPNTTHASLTRSGAGSGVTVNIGMGEGAGSSRMRLDLDDEDTSVVTVYKTATASAGVPAALEIRNANGSSTSCTINVHRGDVFLESPNAVTLAVGYISSKTSDAAVRVYGGSLASLDQSAGVMEVTDCTLTAAIFRDGTATLYGTTAATTVTVYSGLVYDHATGTVATLNLRGVGGWDAERVLGSKTLTNDLEVYNTDAIFRDPNGRFGNITINYNNVAAGSNIVLMPNKSATIGDP